MADRNRQQNTDDGVTGDGLNEHVASLPKALKEKISNEETGLVLRRIASQHNLRETAADLFVKEVFKVLLGLRSADQLAESIQKEIGLESNVANSMSEAVSDTVFRGVEDRLATLSEEMDAEEVTEEGGEEEEGVVESEERVVGAEGGSEAKDRSEEEVIENTTITEPGGHSNIKDEREEEQVNRESAREDLLGNHSSVTQSPGGEESGQHTPKKPEESVEPNHKTPYKQEPTEVKTTDLDGISIEGSAREEPSVASKQSDSDQKEDERVVNEEGLSRDEVLAQIENPDRSPYTNPDKGRPTDKYKSGGDPYREPLG